MLKAFLIVLLAYIALNERWFATYRVPRGRHRAWPYRFGLYLFPKQLKWQVRFDGTSYYTFGDVDDGDTNKLVGICYLPGMHKYSARFGWRNKSEGQVELLAYTYDKGVRKWKSVAVVDRYFDYELEIEVLKNRYRFSVWDCTKKIFIGMEDMPKTHNQKIGLRAGLFFGGNRAAPHDVKVYMKRD